MVNLPPDKSLAGPAQADAEGTQDYRSLESTKTESGESRVGAKSGSLQRGRFSIQRLYAKGGLGQVSVAQDGDLKRTVAVKEIRPDRLDSPAARERFLIEAEITGQLEHPGIVPVHALGQDDGGNPYYAMRFVQGRTLADAIQAHHQTPTALGFRDLLQRFVTVCQTVAYAHSKGVIHRDLKPANIMLGEYGETLVLDWGLAKRIGSAALPIEDTSKEPVTSEDDQLTSAGQVLGTPAFMSPEQALGDTAQVGPATDVYALGAILYQILSGSSPYQGGTDRVLQQLREGPPLRPRQISRGVPPGLEAICLKAMARGIADRYAGALELAEDIDRYLADEPVTVYREPWSVRAGRWVRRHRLAVTGGVTLLVAAVPLLVLLAINSESARRRAQQDNETINSQKTQVDTALDRATKAREFFQNEIILAVRPKGLGLGRDATMKQLLDAAVPKIAPTFADHPEDEATICHVLGKSYYDLGEYERAEPLWRRSRELRHTLLGPEHADTLTVIRQHADALIGVGKAAEAVAILEPALPIFRRVLGDDDFSTRQAMKGLGNALGRLKRFAEAEGLYRTAWEIGCRMDGPDRADTLNTQIALGGVLFIQGKLSAAEPMLRQAWEGLRRIHGGEHPDVLTALNNLASAVQMQGRLDEADPLFREVLAQRRKVLGDDHPQTLLTLNNLGAHLREKGDLDEAEVTYREVVKRRRQILSAEHPSARGSQFHLADLLRARSKLDEAEALARELIALYHKKPHPGTSGPGAEAMLLAHILLDRGQAVEAEKRLREVLAVFHKDKPEGGNETFQANSLLGGSLTAQKRFAEAEPLLLKSYAGFKSSKATPRSQLHEAVTRVVRLYEAWGKEAETAQWRTEAAGGTK